ncbi:MAG: glutathione S-transferase [Rubrivivax sp.]|nr:glutathione S-transferase [Rubrivivax sp.]
MIELLQFRYSPYNEKVRWALDFKRVPHRRTAVLPGPHMPRIKKLTGGATSATPVLVHDGQPLWESTAILDWLEAQHPTPPLVPADAAQAAEARAIAARFDTDIGPRGRRAVLAALMRTPRYFAAVFGAGHGALAQAAYALTVPLAAPMVRKGNGITGEAAIADGHTAFDEGLAYVAQCAAATGYLVGSTFTLADLTAASMLAMCVDPPASPMARPQPMAAPFAALVQRHARHPGADWVRGIYARHRHALTDFNGESAAA